MITRLGKKKNSRSTTVCACGRHFIEAGIEVYGIKVKGTVLYRQTDCHNFPLFNGADIWHSSLITEPSVINADRFYNSYIKVVFSKNSLDRQIQLDYFSKQAGWTIYPDGAVIALTSSYSFSHIYRVVWDEPNIKIMLRNANTNYDDIAISSFEEYKLFTDRGFDFD